jgi:hypothetical protein
VSWRSKIFASSSSRRGRQLKCAAEDAVDIDLR